MCVHDNFLDTVHQLSESTLRYCLPINVVHRVYTIIIIVDHFPSHLHLLFTTQVCHQMSQYILKPAKALTSQGLEANVGLICWSLLVQAQSSKYVGLKLPKAGPKPCLQAKLGWETTRSWCKAWYYLLTPDKLHLARLQCCHSLDQTIACRVSLSQCGDK